MRVRVKTEKRKSILLTPKFIVVGAALSFSTAIPHLTTVLLIVYPETELFALKHTQDVHKVTVTGKQENA